MKLFTKECNFVAGAASADAIPNDSLPEVAFIGRSNVGKSSLLNALTGRKSLARTSQNPGRTQQLNFFNLDKKLMLVDLPGYGYAKASKTSIANWTDLIRLYLRGRVSLRRVYLLIDSRRSVRDSDIEFMKLLDDAAVPYLLTLTKIDKIKNVEQMQVELLAETKKHPASLPYIAITSSEKRTGIKELQANIVEILKS